MKKSSALISFLLLSACAATTPDSQQDDAFDADVSDDDGTNNDDDNANDGDTGDTGEPSDTDSGEDLSSFAPTEGNWTYSNEEMLLDDCNMGDETLDTSNHDKALVTTTAPGEFTLNHRQGDETCVIVDQDFECDSREDTDTTAEEYGLEALMTLTFNTTGTFSDKTNMDFEVHVAVACEGDDCWLIESMKETSMPCDMVIGAALSVYR